MIGDEQSLAQDLSTFSSFVRQVREILTVAGPASLILLDELGAGTDPTEGAALGAALLEALLTGVRASSPRRTSSRSRSSLRWSRASRTRPLRSTPSGSSRRSDSSTGTRAEPRAHDRRAPRSPGRGDRPCPRARRRGEPPDRNAGRCAGRRTRDAEARAAAAARRETAAAGALAQAQVAAERARTDVRELRRAAETGGAGSPRGCAATGRPGARAPEGRRGGSAPGGAGGLPTAAATPEASLQPVPSSTDEPAPPGEVQLRGLGLRGRVVEEADGLVTVQTGSFTVKVSRSEIEPVTAGRPKTPRATVSVPARENAPRELHLLGRRTSARRGGREVPRRRGARRAPGDPPGPRQGHRGAPARRRGMSSGHPLVASFRLAEPAAGGAGATVVTLDEGAARRGRRPSTEPARRPGPEGQPMRVPPRSSTRSGRASISWTSWGRSFRSSAPASDGRASAPSIREDAVLHGQPEAKHLLLLRVRMPGAMRSSSCAGTIA